MKVRRKKRSAPEMPTSALSDIALLLLIFFIVTTEFLVQRSIPAELPAITPDQKEASEDLITVVVAEDFLYLDEERIHMGELAPYLAAKLTNRVSREERAVVLDARASVRYQRVVEAAGQIKKAGGVITMMEVEE